MYGYLKHLSIKDLKRFYDGCLLEPEAFKMITHRPDVTLVTGTQEFKININNNFAIMVELNIVEFNNGITLDLYV